MLFRSQGYGQLKQAVADVVIEALAPLQQRYRELTADPATLDEVLRAGAARAAVVANATLRDVKEATGLI